MLLTHSLTQNITQEIRRKIETMDALRAPDSDQFIAAIRKEVHSLISETRTLQPLSRTTAPNGYSENTENKQAWKIRTTLK